MKKLVLLCLLFLLSCENKDEKTVENFSESNSLNKIPIDDEGGGGTSGACKGSATSLGSYGYRDDYVGFFNGWGIHRGYHFFDLIDGNLNDIPSHAIITGFMAATGPNIVGPMNKPIRRILKLV